jgi:dTDP-4-dehydrorhamnose 3,5-epimerase
LKLSERIKSMEITTTELPGVLILTPKRFGDDRGFFSEVYNRDVFMREGIDIVFVQDNHSLSRDVGVVRGLHFQSPPHAQDKLVRVGAGVVFDVAVDIRKGSPTYGDWIGVELSAENGKQLLVPKGFLHGFITRAPNSELLYKCSDVYAPDCDGAVNFADESLAIDWGMPVADAILSDKDRAAQSFADFESPFVWEGNKQ